MLNSFYVQGYRSFGARMEVQDLHQITMLYGLNNSGKTNLLRALELFSHLLKLPLVNLTGPGFIEPLERFQERTGQSEAMFSRYPTPATRINMGGRLSSGDEIDLVIHLEGTSIRVELSGWASGLENPLRDLHDTEELLANLGMGHDLEARWKLRWADLATQSRYKLVTPKIPLSAGVRSEVSRKLRSSTVADRLRTKRLLRSFSEIAIGLPPGELDEFAHAPTYPEDFAWVTESSVIPLDDLGSGAQWIFALIAELALLPGSATLLIDEPESHLNARLQDDLCAWLVKWSQAEGKEAQILMASHSLNFARPEWDLRRIEFRDGNTTLNKVDPPHLAGLAPHLPLEQRQPGQFDGLVGHDGSIKLPQNVRQTLGISPGQYVYFVPGTDGRFEIVSQDAMDHMLGGEGPDEGT